MFYDNIIVEKRSGITEQFTPKKINTVTEWCAKNLKGVASSEIEVVLSKYLPNGTKLKSTDLHDLVIKSVVELISIEKPNYQYAAARAVLFKLRKDVLGSFEPTHLSNIINANLERKLYDPLLVQLYTPFEINIFNDYMKHERDFNFTFAGLQQLIDKYLVRNRITKTLYETPQYMYMLIAMALFKGETNKEQRIGLVKRYYDQISTFKINIPTPIMSGARTPTRQYSSCVLIDIDDTLSSINHTRIATSEYIARKAGIGFNFRIRALGDSIRNGEVEHTGIVPYIQTLERTVKETVQNGIRGGGATCFLPFWHLQIKDFIVLKNNKGTEENRARGMDYCVKLSKLFYERALKREKVTLFSPKDVPELADAFGMPEFDSLYRQAEKRKGIRKVKIDAMEFLIAIALERTATGRIYLLNTDHANSHSSFIEQIVMSNLCVEVLLITKPIQHISDPDGEIALCILSAINVGECHTEKDIEETCEMAVRGLDSVIDEQEYVCPAAEIPAKKRRPLGIGVTNLAYLLASKKLKYSSPESIQLVHDLQEMIQFYLLKASNKIAQEKGACEWFHKTKYAQGLLPIDTYRRNVDELCDGTLKMDWEGLRELIKQHGLRNSTLSAQMPCESSSVATNSTNGIEPVKKLKVVKRSKKGSLTQLAPGVEKFERYYEKCYDMPNNKGYLSIVAVMQKFIDQSISCNTYYDYEKYPNEEVPVSEIIDDILFGYRYGIKTFYYSNTPDESSDEEGACAGGGCAV